MRLEEPQLSRFLETDTAGREIRYTSVFKLDPGVRDVGLLREHRNPDRSNFPNRCRHQAQNDVNVVNHEIENHVDVETARRKRGEPMDLEKLWLGGDLARGCYYRIESLDMANLQDPVVPGRSVDQRLGLFKGGRDRLLDKNVDAMFEKVRANASVIHCGNRQAHRVDLAEEFVVIRERGCLVEASNFFRTRLQYVDDTDQFSELGIKPRMLPPEMSHSNNCNFSHNKTKRNGHKKAQNTVFCAFLWLFHRDNRDTCLIRDADQLVSIDHQCLTRFDGQCRNVEARHQTDSSGADHRDIKPQILIGLR